MTLKGKRVLEIACPWLGYSRIVLEENCTKAEELCMYFVIDLFPSTTWYAQRHVEIQCTLCLISAPLSSAYLS